MDLGIFYFLAADFFYLYLLESLVRHLLNMHDRKHIFSSFLKPPGCNCTHVDIKNIRDLYRGISDFKKGYQPKG
jgi:hypothetical protein